MKILLLNYFSRNSTAVLYGLENQHEFFVARPYSNSKYEDKFRFAFTPNRYGELHFYCNPTKDLQQFKDDLLSIIDKTKVDVVIPTGTTVTTALSILKPELSKKTLIPVEDFKSFSILNEKWSFYNVCNKLNIPIPKTELLQTVDVNVPDKFSFPFVLKPSFGYSQEGYYLIEDVEQFQKVTKRLKSMDLKINLGSKNMMIQEYISTWDNSCLYDSAVVSKNGKIISSYSQRRLVTASSRGGGGILNISEEIPQIQEYAERIVKYLNWTGVSEFDFIKDKNDKYLCLEANPKIWGTTKLAIISGINIPLDLLHAYDCTAYSSTSKQNNGILMKWWIHEGVKYFFEPPFHWKGFFKKIKSFSKIYLATKVYGSLHNELLKYKLFKVIQSFFYFKNVIK